MFAWLLGIAIAFSVRLIPALVGIRFWERYTKGEKAIIILLSYDAIAIIIGAFLAYYYRNNLIMTHFYAAIEVFLLSIFYKEFIVSKTVSRLLTWFPLLYAVVFMSIAVFVVGVHSSSPSAAATRAIFSIILTSMILGELSGEDENLIKQGHFWIVIGVLGYYLLNVGYLVTKYRMIETNSDLIYGLQRVLRYSFYVLNMFYALGLWLIASNRTKVITSS